MKVRPGTALYSLLFLIWGVSGGEEGGLISPGPPPPGLGTQQGQHPEPEPEPRQQNLDAPETACVSAQRVCVCVVACFQALEGGARRGGGAFQSVVTG